MNVINKCNECSHASVCKYFDIASRIKGKSTILFDELAKEFTEEEANQFEIEIKCRKFSYNVVGYSQYFTTVSADDVKYGKDSQK